MRPCSLVYVSEKYEKERKIKGGDKNKMLKKEKDKKKQRKGN